MDEELDEELEKVRVKQREAMAGLQGNRALAAGIRVAFDHAIETQNPDLSNLEKILGERLDAGSFLMGMQCAAFAMQGMNALVVVKDPIVGPLVKESIARARSEHKEYGNPND